MNARHRVAKGIAPNPAHLLRARVCVHELALMEDLITAVMEESSDVRVHIVRLRVGRDACVSTDALKFCFDVCTRGTTLEGAALEIVEGAGDELRLQELEVT